MRATLKCHCVLFMVCLPLPIISTVTQVYDVDFAEIRLPLGVGDFSSYGAPPGDLSLRIYAPNSSKSFPVIWFVTGGGGIAPVSDYSKLLSEIVARGYIVVGLAHGAFPPFNYPKYGKAFHDMMEWGKDNLASQMASQKLMALPDVLNRSAVMGHSAGNHVIGQGLTDGCSVAKAFVMIDPVDGFDPFRFIKSQDLIKPGHKVTFYIPALLLNNGLDPTSVNRLEPACAPANISNDHFYDAWLGPIWNINATKYGHLDCTNSPNRLLCPSDTNIDSEMYKSMIADAIATFLNALFDTKPDDLAILEDNSHWKVDVVLKHDLKGLSHSDIRPGCMNHNYQAVLV